MTTSNEIKQSMEEILVRIEEEETLNGGYTELSKALKVGYAQYADVYRTYLDREHKTLLAKREKELNEMIREVMIRCKIRIEDVERAIVKCNARLEEIDTVASTYQPPLFVYQVGE